VRRIEGRAKVTGQLAFAEDLPLMGLAHGQLVLSHLASGRIRSIDVPPLSRMPGVIAVLTAKDLACGSEGPDAPLAGERVCYVGQPVAVVVAETQADAADAAASVRVECGPLPVVASVDEALRAGAPRVLPEAAIDRDDRTLHGAVDRVAASSAGAGNLLTSAEVRRGDAGAAIAAAAVVVRGRYQVPSVHHAPIETHVVAARADPDGSVTVWSPTQALSVARRRVAQALRTDLAQVRVIPMPVGGGFGGKILLLEPLAALVARAVGRPVRILLTRAEEFLVAHPAPSAEIALELGATADGDLVALRGEVTFDNGAAEGWHAGVACELIASTYRVPNVDLVGREVATNKVPSTSYRAPGAPQASFALESCMDELARRLALDPLRLRLRNASRAGDPIAGGSTWPRIGLVECLEAAARHPAYVGPTEPGEGVGVAAAGWMGWYSAASAVCLLDRRGTFVVHLGSVDITGTDTVFAAIAAERLGVSAESISVQKTDSATAPPSPVSAGSAITYSVAPAVLRAAEEARRQVLEIAAERLEAAPDDLDLRDGRAFVRGSPSRGMTLAEVAHVAYGGTAPSGPVHAVGRAAVRAAAPMFCVHIARVRVDEESGRIVVTRYVAIHDVGHAFNRPEIVAQIHGGVAQGLGRALGEELVYDTSGGLRNGSFADYVLPTVDMVPDVDVELLEIPSEHGLMGARGVGEPPAAPGLATIGNAIRDATGRRLSAAPFGLESLAATVAPARTSAGAPATSPSR